VADGEIIVPNIFRRYADYPLTSVIKNQYHAENIGDDLTLIRLRDGDSVKLLPLPEGGFCLLATTPGTVVEFADGTSRERRRDGWYVDEDRLSEATTMPVHWLKAGGDMPRSQLQVGPGFLQPEDTVVESKAGTMRVRGVILGTGSIARAGKRTWAFGDLTRTITGGVAYGQVTLCAK
jgi:hypothetical protein